MDSSGPASATERQIDRELGLVADAIAMVASGASPRVTVGGLRFGDAILAAAERLAREAGVRIVPQWPADESGIDIAVEPIPATPR
jgi:hypothetical protein